LTGRCYYVNTKNECVYSFSSVVNSGRVLSGCTPNQLSENKPECGLDSLDTNV